MDLKGNRRNYISRIKEVLFTPKGWCRKAIKVIWIGTSVSLVAVLLYIYAVIVNPFDLFGSMPTFEEIENPKNDLSSEVISADGVSLGRFFRYNRSMVTFQELSPALVKTLLISEDHRFYEHSGLDFHAYFRVLAGLVTFNAQGGGSTLTQQTAKNLFSTRGKELQGTLGKIATPIDLLISKTKEWIIAIRLERNFTKEEILTLYLNTVPFNNSAYGIKIAAETYFQKEPAQLNIQESALLVGMLQGTTRFNPLTFPDRALRKRNEVFQKLLVHHYLASKQQTDSLKLLPLGLNVAIQNHNEGLAPYFRSVLQAEMTEWCKKRGIDLLQSGLKIYTTIDSRLQTYAERAMKNHMAKLQSMFDKDWGNRNPWVDDNQVEIKNYLDRKVKQSDEYKNLLTEYHDKDSITLMLNEKKRMNIFSWTNKKDTVLSITDYVRYMNRFLHCGLMSMDPSTGEVKAWVGGINHTYFKYDHVRQSARQPGSTFKPFVYGLAMENGFSPCQQFYDASPSLIVNGKTYQVKNANGTYGDNKLYTLRQALAKSLNSVTMQLMHQLNPTNVAAFAQRLGITSKLDPVYSLALGTSSVSLFDMVGAYGSFINAGIYTKPHYITRIEDQYGNVLENFGLDQKQVIDAATAYKIVYLLKGGVEESGGSSQALSTEVKGDNDIGGKTGTTDNGSDGWYMGITHNLITGVWVGGDEPSIHFPRWGEGSGGKTALPIFDNYMKEVYAHPVSGYTKGRFKVPLELDMNLDCSKYLQDSIQSF